MISQGWGGNSNATANNNYPNANIKPEKVVSYEFGTDVRLFDSRFCLDFTYYKSITTDLIVPATLTPTAGFDTKLLNVGKMTNEGVELMVEVTPIRTRDIKWSVNFNFATNKNKVVKLAEDMGLTRIRQLERWASLEMRTADRKGGGNYGSIYGGYNKRTDDGQLILKNGLPVEDNQDWAYLGNVNPDWTGGIGTDLKWGNLAFSALLGIQHGGVVYSRSFVEGVRAGSLIESAPLRGADGTATIIADGIDQDTGLKNTVPVSVRSYVQKYFAPDQEGTFDASYIKLREVKLAYTLPLQWFLKTPIKKVELAVYGRNLFVITDVPNFDPEVASYDGQMKGIETMALPSTRSFGFNLNVTL